jgi:hypothetical protein
MEVSSISERVRPSLSRHCRMTFCRTTLPPSAVVNTVSLVPRAEYGAPVTSRTLLDMDRDCAELASAGGQAGISTTTSALAGSAATSKAKDPNALLN